MSESGGQLPEPDATGRLYFEDMPVGASWVSPRRTITEADVTTFAGVSGDFNPLHVDEVFAAGSAFGRRVAHGTLVLAIASGLRQQMPIFRGSLRALLEFRSWKFLAPVFFGDTIVALTTVTEARETKRADQGVVVQRVDIINQDGKTVQSGELVSLVGRLDGR
jgi:acyl dehydratase